MARAIFQTDEYGEAVVELDLLTVLLMAAATRSGCRSETALARLLGVSRMTLCDWRRQESRPSGLSLAAILAAGGFPGGKKFEQKQEEKQTVAEKAQKTAVS